MSHRKTLLPAFHPISLEHLNAQVELMERIDRKYILPTNILPDILTDMQSGYFVLTIDGKQYFDYDTIYLDTASRESYDLHQNKAKKRWKARTRKYIDSNISFFECKIKDGMTRKYRFAIANEEHGKVSPQAQLFVSELIKSHCQTELTEPLVPYLQVRYTRSTLCSKDNSERVTIDTDLAFCVPGSDQWISIPHVCIIEAKSQTTSSAFDRLIKAYNHKPMNACSKYALGLIYTGQATVWSTFARTIAHINFLSIQYNLVDRNDVHDDKKKSKKSNHPHLV